MKKQTQQTFEFIASVAIGIVTLGFYTYVVHGTHKEMVWLPDRPVHKLTYPEFKKLFRSAKWSINKWFPGSLFIEGSYDEIHASIYRINNISYQLSPFGLLMSRFLIDNEIKRLKRERQREFISKPA